jgi:hypothetical protein
MFFFSRLYFFTIFASVFDTVGIFFFIGFFYFLSCLDGG